MIYEDEFFVFDRVFVHRTPNETEVASMVLCRVVVWKPTSPLPIKLHPLLRAAVEELSGRLDGAGFSIPTETFFLPWAGTPPRGWRARKARERISAEVATFLAQRVPRLTQEIWEVKSVKVLDTGEGVRQYERLKADSWLAALPPATPARDRLD